MSKQYERCFICDDLFKIGTGGQTYDGYPLCMKHCVAHPGYEPQIQCPPEKTDRPQQDTGEETN